MKNLKSNIAGMALGAASGLGGLVILSRCSGHCSACYSCIGVGASVAIVALAHKTVGIRAAAKKRKSVRVEDAP